MANFLAKFSNKLAACFVVYCYEMLWTFWCKHMKSGARLAGSAGVTSRSVVVASGGLRLCLAPQSNYFGK